MKKILLTIIILLVAILASWNVGCYLGERNGDFTGLGSIIKKTHDLDTTIFELKVAGLDQEILDNQFGLISIKLNIRHQNFTNLDMYLVAPSGERVELTNCDGDDMPVKKSIAFCDTASQQIFTSGFPYGGTYRPHGFLAWFNNHCKGNGVWKLKIVDTNRRKGRGILIYWQLHFGKNPVVPVTIKSSPLPLIVVNCDEVSPSKTHHAKGTMQVIYHDDGSENKLSDSSAFPPLKVELKLRGNSSVKLPKKNYSVKLDSKGKQTASYSLAGIRPTSEWVLGSNLMDRTLIRNPLTHTLYQQMGDPAVENKLCEVIWNNQYIGIYLLSEKPDQSIIQSKLETGKIKEYGKQFVLCKDNYSKDQIAWNSSNKSLTPRSKNPRLIIKYPNKKRDAERALPEIKKYFDEFDNLLASPNRIKGDTTYRNLIDMQSFIDYIIISELSKNNDGYKLSSYLYRPYNGKIFAGPVWDFDRAYGNLASDSSWQKEGWKYMFLDSGATNGVPVWWNTMMEDKYFAQQLANRWDFLRKDILSDQKIERSLDSLVKKIEPVIARNFKIWPVFSVDRHGFFYSETVKNYTDELEFLRKFIFNRVHWLDAHVHDRYH
ncbi:hypothetical protein BH11BAC2_BH11BAC2_08090 [soil metagenome]